MDLWHRIETAPTSAAWFSWKHRFGDALPLVQPWLLKPLKKRAETVPCPHACGCIHRVMPDNRAVCGCGDCEDIELRGDEVEAWEFDPLRMGRAVAAALDGEACVTPFGPHRTIQVAAAGSPPLPVLLTIQPNDVDFRNVVGELVARLPEGFVLIAPTKRFCNAAANELLGKVGAGFFDLETNVLMSGNGELAAHQHGKELFARLLAEQSNRRTGEKRQAPRYSFQPAGSMCDIVFNGCRVFHLRNTDGAKYLDYLLHNPNKAIRAFDLERKIKPEKAGVREENSIQQAVDAQAKREARQELVALAAELEEAEAEGQTAKVKRLKGEIAKVKAVAGNESVLGGETGERARDNVRKAIEKVLAKLRKGNKDEQAFGVHISQSVSLGYDVSYNQERIKWG